MQDPTKPYSLWANRIARNLSNPVQFIDWWLYQKSRTTNDYFLITMNHGGTHWLRMLLVKALIDKYNLEDQPQDIKNFDLIPPYHRKQYRFKYNNRPEIPRIQQAHTPYESIHFKNACVLFLVRDLRDTLVSNYKSHSKRQNLEISFSDFLREHEKTKIKKAHSLDARIDFLNSWHKARPCLSGVKIIRFEDLKASPNETLRDATEFLGLFSSEDQLSKCLEFASLENMKHLEHRAPSQKNKNMALKVGAGKSGSYKDWFSESDREYFQTKVQSRLQHDFGYNYSQW